MFFRAITTVTSLFVAALLTAISFKSVSAVTIHIQNQTPNSAMIPLVTAIVTILLAINFAAPTMRLNMLVRSYRPLGRFFFILLCLSIIAGITLAATMILYSGTSSIYGVIPTTLIQPMGVALGVLFALTFIFPGFAFRDLRKVHAESKISHSSSYHSAQTPRQDHTPPKKNAISILTNSLFNLSALGFIGIGFYGAREARFLPSSPHLKWASDNEQMIIAVCIGFFAVLIMLGSRSPGKWAFKSSNVQKLAQLVLISLGVVFLNFSLITKGLPDILSFLTTGNDDRQIVVVQQVGKEIRRRGCNRTAIVAPVDSPDTPATICDIPSEIWNTLTPGAQLTLTGEQTPYGLHYSNITRSGGT